MITAATTEATTVSQRGATRSWSFALLAVKITSGTTAKGSWKLSTTWLKTSSLPAMAPPNQ